MSDLHLIIDTSTRHGAVGLHDGAAMIRSEAWLSRHNHTAELLPAIDHLLAAQGATVDLLRGIAVARGPGGFSALRAGLGVAKGFAFARGIPLVGVSTLEATAYPLRDVGLPICALLEAGQGAVAWARFEQRAGGWRRATPERVTPLDRMLGKGGRRLLFCGEGASRYRGEIEAVAGARARFVDGAPHMRLRGVAELGVARLARGESDAVASLEPRYLRPPGITPAKATTAVKLGAAPRAMSM